MLTFFVNKYKEKIIINKLNEAKNEKPRKFFK